MNSHSSNEERDRRVLELLEQVMEIEQRMIPTGLHVFGRASSNAETADLLRMVASFERPELGTRALTDLIAEGLSLPPYAELVKQSGQSPQLMIERERVEAIARESVVRFLAAGESSAEAAGEFLLTR